MLTERRTNFGWNFSAKARKSAGCGKKRWIAVTAMLMLACLLLGGCVSLSEDEQLAYENAMTLRNALGNPDNFALGDEIYLLELYDETGAYECTYTVMPYSVGSRSDRALFKNGVYVMDYSASPDKYDPDFISKMLVKGHILLYELSEMVGTENDEMSFVCVDIDAGKLRSKMGLK